MKEKEPTSLKAISQATRPYPNTPRPSSQSTRSGPKYFPPNTLQEDDLELAMDTIPYEFNVKSSNPSSTEPPSDGLANSIHAPSNPTADHMMNEPPSPNVNHVPSPEEQTILAHLALADMNRSVLSQNGTSHGTILPQFTPAPIGGFPTVHMSHSAQIFDHLDNRVLLAWFQVEHPKFMVRVFDHSGKEVAERTAIIAERLRANITIIAESIHNETPSIRVSPPQPQGGKGAKNLPCGFLVHKVSNETKNLILNQRIWSTTDLTFEALPFNCTHPPDLLFGLSGFTTLDTATILQAVTETWSHDENRYRIEELFSKCGLPDDELIYKATRDFIMSCRVEMLDFKIPGGLSVPRFNILATSPTNDAKTWTDLRIFLSTLTYPTNLDGCGSATALFACQICHSLAHPRGLCPFPTHPKLERPESRQQE
ncbi:hypothetical protein DEU56DRAFT_914310 [Suillus clintonianus]|uniref:uncharacterized protein n=1 Tax=Suillus clintonianus TaxID=1904413 RepID=UPI001B8806AC|nr:uncharacterized protein DEU56DRAFT_914310 [Suillus clintonianus]KAG2131744.1 hypothetical protein DEU56DRAFT_914310 [Suillus clintonianus]